MGEIRDDDEDEDDQAIRESMVAFASGQERFRHLADAMLAGGRRRPGLPWSSVPR